MADADQQDLTLLTVNLLSAYFTTNTIDSAALPGLIQTTHDALRNINSPPAEAMPEPAHTPAVSVRKSLSSRDHIISMIDGRPYKTLKRHLTSHGLTPAEYRERYNLARDYPMVAPAYSEHRRDVAEKLGLGRRINQRSAQSERNDTAVPKEASAPAKASKVRGPSRAAGKAKAVGKTPAVAKAPAVATTPTVAKASAASKAPAVTKAQPDTSSLAMSAPAPAVVKSGGKPPKKTARTKAVSRVAAPVPPSTSAEGPGGASDVTVAAQARKPAAKAATAPAAATSRPARKKASTPQPTAGKPAPFTKARKPAGGRKGAAAKTDMSGIG